MGGVTLPTANTPGYGSITRNGRTFVGCDCVIAFIKAGERFGLAAGKLREGLDIVQLTGNASASGGVHRLGAAFDVLQYDSWWVQVWRNMGAAFWPRLDPNPGVPGDLWDNNQHGHGGIDCPHNSLIAYQNKAYRAGYNGLGQGTVAPHKGEWGYGAKDNTYRPPTFRSWRDGIAWANAEAARLEARKAATTKPPAPKPAATTSVSLASTPGAVGSYQELTLTAKVTPAGVPGSVTFEWLHPDGRWLLVGNATVVTGVAKVNNRPATTVQYRARFVPKDAAAFKASTSAVLKVPVVDLAKLAADVEALKAARTAPAGA